MLILKELKLRNFRSWKSLHLEDIDTYGLVLINGRNGSGKSSIRQAIEYLLLDSVIDIGKVEDLTFNKQGNCKLYCKLQKNEDIIEITKYRDDKTNGNSIILKVNGNDSLTASDRRETQKEIASLLGISVDEIYISTIFTIRSPSFPEAKDSERKDLLYKARNLGQYNEFLSRTKKIVSELENEKKKLETEAIYSESLLSDMKLELKELINSEKEFEDDRKLKIKKKKDEKLNNSQKDTTELTDELLKYKDVLSISYKELQAEHHKLLLNISKKENKRDILTKELEQTESSICPILNKNCTVLAANIKTVKNNLSYDLSKIETELDSLIEEIEDINTKMNRRLDFTNLNTKLQQIIDHNTTVQKLNYKYEDDIKEITTSKNPYKSLIDKKTIEISEINRNIVRHKDKIKELLNRLQYYKFWVTGFGKEGIPNLKIEAFLEQIENKTNEILTQVSDRMFVNISSQTTSSTGNVRERISYDVLSPDKTITDYISYSGGQKQRVKIADIFSFNNLLSKFSFIILDECLELSLDDRGKQEVLEFLKKQNLVGDLSTIMVISHDEQVKDNFDNIINIEMVNGESFLT